MWLILTDTGDPEGPWLADGLATRLPGPIVHLTTRDLVEGCRWERRFEDGEECFRFHTATGVSIDQRSLRGVVNRLRMLPAGPTGPRFIARQPEYSRDAGTMLLHCLHRLTCPLLNPPGAHGVSGDQHTASEWAALARRAGLRCLPDAAARERDFSPSRAEPAWAERIRGLPTRHLLTIGPRLLPGSRSAQIPDDVAAGVCRLAAFARCPLLNVQLVEASPTDWLFRTADTHTGLLAGGLAALDAIAAALAAKPVVSTAAPTAV